LLFLLFLRRLLRTRDGESAEERERDGDERQEAARCVASFGGCGIFWHGSKLFWENFG
jgi:hypothetical protein